MEKSATHLQAEIILHDNIRGIHFITGVYFYIIRYQSLTGEGRYPLVKEVFLN